MFRSKDGLIESSDPEAVQTMMRGNNMHQGTLQVSLTYNICSKFVKYFDFNTNLCYIVAVFHAMPCLYGLVDLKKLVCIWINGFQHP